MGNKIISFQTDTSDSTVKTSLEVYIDLNMESKPHNNTLYQNESDYLQKMKYEIDKSVNVKAIFNSLNNIFTWIPGERILEPEFGSNLRHMLYEGITEYNTEKIISEIRGCISKWEPRVQVTDIVNVSNVDDTEDNTVQIDIVFTVPGLSTEQYNYSYMVTRNS